MTPSTLRRPIDMGMRTTRLTLTGSDGIGWLSRALLVSLSCLVWNCAESNPSNSSGGVGGASAGGTASSIGGANGSSKDAGSAKTSTTGGASVESGSGGAPGSTTSAKGGASSNKSDASGGATTPGGASGSSAAATAAQGGRSGKGGASGGDATGGKSSKSSASGGVTSTGGKSSSGTTVASGGKSSSGGTTGASTVSSTFALTSPEWTNMQGCGPEAKTSCAPLPTEITRSGAGTSPELRWSGAPEGTKSFVILFQDLNNGTAHWILWNIPATATGLAANVDRTTATPAVPAGSQQCGKGSETATADGYFGPGAPCNVYEFVVYALSVEKFSPTKPTEHDAVRTQLQALGNSILGTASLRGRTNQGC